MYRHHGGDLMDSILRALTLLCLGLTQVAQAQTYEQLKDTIEKNDVKSIATLLPYLSKEYRAEFTLMMKSQSLQEASSDFPRVILSGQDGRLLLAFNGDASQKGFDKLEVIQFRDDSERFDFYEVRFPEKDQNGRPLNNLTKAEFSARNPAKCLSCHTSDPRPNWQHYARWPGAFLGNDDRTTDEGHLPEYDAYLPRLQNEFPRHDRYKYLENVVEGYKYDGFRHGERNIHVTERIYRLNYLRVSRILKADPNYDAYKFLITGILGCGEKTYEAYLPAGFPAFSQVIDDFYQNHFDDIYTKRKIYVGDLFPDFKSVRPFFTVPSRVSEPMSYGFVKGDPELEPYFTISTTNEYGFKGGEAEVKDCGALQRLSRQRLASVAHPEDEARAREQARPKILNRCMECHTSGGVGLGGPHVPFDDVARLKQHLNYSGYAHGKFFDEAVYRLSATGDQRMPPEGLSDRERAELVEYFRAVK